MGEKEGRKERRSFPWFRLEETWTEEGGREAEGEEERSWGGVVCCSLRVERSVRRFYPLDFMVTKWVKAGWGHTPDKENFSQRGKNKKQENKNKRGKRVDPKTSGPSVHTGRPPP